jgi:hypothetical protein
MGAERTRRHGEAYASSDLESNPRGVDGRSRVMKQHRQPQRQDLCAYLFAGEHVLHFGEPTAAAKNKQGKPLLLSGGEPRHVGVLQNVRAVLVIADVRHRHPGFMQQGRPLQQLRLRGIRFRDCAAKERDRERGHTRGV